MSLNIQLSMNYDQFVKVLNKLPHEFQLKSLGFKSHKVNAFELFDKTVQKTVAYVNNNGDLVFNNKYKNDSLKKDVTLFYTTRNRRFKNGRSF